MIELNFLDNVMSDVLRVCSKFVFGSFPLDQDEADFVSLFHNIVVSLVVVATIEFEFEFELSLSLTSK